jgi:catalase
MGTVVIRSVVADTLTAQMTLLYLPTSVPDGIEPADPMIAIRTGEYGVSFGRRSSAPKGRGN